MWFETAVSRLPSAMRQFILAFALGLFGGQILASGSCPSPAAAALALDTYPDRFRLGEYEVGVDYGLPGAQAGYPGVRHVVPPLFVGWPDGRAEVVPDVQRLSVFDAHGQALPWTEAVPVLVSGTALQLHISATFADSEVSAVRFRDGGRMVSPKVLGSFLPLVELERADYRARIYQAAFLHMFSDMAFAEALQTPTEAEVERALQRTQHALATYGFGHDLAWGARTFAGVQAAAQHGQSALGVGSKVGARLDAGSLAKSLQGAQLIAKAVDVASAFNDGRARARVLAEAYRRSQTLDLIEDLLQIMRAEAVDPALVAGLVAARDDMARFSDSVIEQIRAGARQAGGVMTEAAISLLITQAAVHLSSPYLMILGEIAALDRSVDELSRSASMLAALLTVDTTLRDLLSSLVRDGRAGGVSADELNLARLIDFQQRLNFQLASELYSALWTGRFSVSAAGLAKWMTFGVKDRLNPGVQEARASIRDQHLGQLLARQAIEARLPELLDALSRKYAGPVQGAAGGCHTLIAIVDSSGSMRQNDPNNLRLAALRLLADSLGEGARFGLVEFDSQARTLYPLTTLSAYGGPEREALRRVIAGMRAGGMTDIRGGLELALQMANQAGVTPVLVLMSDGEDNVTHWRGEADFIPPGVVVHSIAFSHEADPEALALVSAATGGVAEIALTPDELQRVLGNLFGEAAGDEVMLLAEGTLRQGETITHALVIEPGQREAEFRVSWPGSDIDLHLTAPDGRAYTSKQAVQHGFGLERPTYDIIRVANPTPGTWQVGVVGVQLAAGGEPYTLRVAGRDTTQQARWLANVTVPEIGQPYALDLTGEAVRWERADVSLWLPDGQRLDETHTLGGLQALLGAGSGQTIYTLLPRQEGVHRILITVHGRTLDGAAVMRSLDRSFRVAAPGQGVRRAHAIDPFIRREAHR